MSQDDQREFDDFLQQYFQTQDRDERERIEYQMWDRFGVEQAVYVLDMVGFSRLTVQRGLAHYMSMVRRMQLTTRPIIEMCRGRVVKYEADNCFCRFPDTLDAIEAARVCARAFTAMNLKTEDDLDIHISSGIDYGEFLLIGGVNFFGTPVNGASKLGEDLAAPGEIWVTDRAMQRVPTEAGIKTVPKTITMSGLELPVHRVIVD